MMIEIMNKTPIMDMYSVALATRGIIGNSPMPKHPHIWVKDAILAEHSILHEVRVKITDPECRSDVVSHLVRHTNKMPRHYVQSQRPDFTGAPRPKDPAATRLYVSTWPADALLVMARQRLCGRAMPETEDWVIAVKEYLLNFNDPTATKEQELFARALGWAMVPNCIYRCGCPEGKYNCGWFELTGLAAIDYLLKERYDWYNEQFTRNMKRKGG